MKTPMLLVDYHESHLSHTSVSGLSRFQSIHQQSTNVTVFLGISFVRLNRMILSFDCLKASPSSKVIDFFFPPYVHHHLISIYFRSFRAGSQGIRCAILPRFRFIDDHRSAAAWRADATTRNVEHRALSNASSTLVGCHLTETYVGSC